MEYVRNKIDLSELKYIFDEIQSQLSHLIRSQQEIQNFIEEGPEDVDLVSAYNENKEVIYRKYVKLNEISSLMKEIDPLCHIELKFSELSTQTSTISESDQLMNNCDIISGIDNNLTIDEISLPTVISASVENASDEVNSNNINNDGLYL